MENSVEVGKRREGGNRDKYREIPRNKQRDECLQMA